MSEQPLRVLVTGGRHYRDAARIDEVLSRYDIAVLAHGAAGGADTLAGRWAEQHLVPVKGYPADWLGPCTNQCRPGHRRRRGTSTYCPMAGIYRNHDMLEDFRPDLVITFPGGTGTADMTRRAVAALGADRVIRA